MPHRCTDRVPADDTIDAGSADVRPDGTDIVRSKLVQPMLAGAVPDDAVYAGAAAHVGPRLWLRAAHRRRVAGAGEQVRLEFQGLRSNCPYHHDDNRACGARL